MIVRGAPRIIHRKVLRYLIYISITFTIVFFLFPQRRSMQIVVCSLSSLSRETDNFFCDTIVAEQSVRRTSNIPSKLLALE
jgi:hypothetical protein